MRRLLGFPPETATIGYAILHLYFLLSSIPLRICLCTTEIIDLNVHFNMTDKSPLKSPECIKLLNSISIQVLLAFVTNFNTSGEDSH